MQEIWKKLKYTKNGIIYDFSDRYLISNLGRLKSLDYNSTKKEKILKQASDKDGYKIVCLRKNGSKRNEKVHRLVALMFLEKDKNKNIVNHKDENKQNNRVDNLEWCTNKYNIRYSKSKKINQYDLKGNFIKQWGNLQDIADYYKVSKTAISNCCLNKVNKSCDYIWRYVKNGDKMSSK